MLWFCDVFLEVLLSSSASCSTADFTLLSFLWSGIVIKGFAPF